MSIPWSETVCVMCQGTFPQGYLDFVGRCPECFRKYMELSDKGPKPELGIPFTPVSKATK